MKNNFLYIGSQQGYHGWEANPISMSDILSTLAMQDEMFCFAHSSRLQKRKEESKNRLWDEECGQETY